MSSCNTDSFVIYFSTAVIGRGTQLSNGNVVGAFCEVTSNEVLPENTVIYGDNCSRRIQAERPPVSTEGMGGVIYKGPL